MTRTVSIALSAVLALLTAVAVFFVAPQCSVAATSGPNETPSNQLPSQSPPQPDLPSFTDNATQGAPSTVSGAATETLTCSGSRPLAAAIALIGSLLAAAAGIAGAGSRPAPVTPASPPDPRPAQQRSDLARALASLSPQMPPGLGAEADKALAAAGIAPYRPDGKPFDPQLHQAVGSEPAPTPAQIRTVARTERPGYVDNGRVLVQPLVVVYTDGPGAPSD